jgi:hypothetical protein
VRREKELRCFCKRAPLLATYGLDSAGKLFVHVKIWKARRIFGELVIEGGTVKIRCRECLRWHRITIHYNKAVLREAKEDLPEFVDQANRMLDTTTLPD